MSPERTPSAQEQIARNGIVSEVPGSSPAIESATPMDDSAEKQEADSGRVLSVGERVSVLRSPKPGSTEKWVDRSGWKVVETNPSTTKVEKIMPNGVEVSTKTVATAELVALQERLDEKLRRDLGEEAVEISGIKQPEEVAPESAQAEAPEEETERGMLERFAREYQAEKSRLYAELRGVEPSSRRAAELENLINFAKEDIERVDKRLRNL